MNTATPRDLAAPATPGGSDDARMLALVQEGMVISTFPGYQVEAAIDLARVLCRALAQPIEIFRLRSGDATGLYSGAVVGERDAAWALFAQVRPDWPGSVRVELQEADGVREACAAGMP